MTNKKKESQKMKKNVDAKHPNILSKQVFQRSQANTERTKSDLEVISEHNTELDEHSEHNTESDEHSEHDTELDEHYVNEDTVQESPFEEAKVIDKLRICSKE